MQIVESSYKILCPANQAEVDQFLQLIELAGRTCYKSEHKITQTSAQTFIKMLRDKKHTAMLEHSILSVKFIIDRGLSHELVRHRIASFAQESTRYCDYGTKGIQVIKPRDIELDTVEYDFWFQAMQMADAMYYALRQSKCKPQIARSVLPTCLKTELVITANWTEWKHIFRMRTDSAVHPDLRAIMLQLLQETKSLIPVVFDDIEVD